VTADHKRRGGCTRDVGSHTITLSPIGDTVVCRRGETVLTAILRSGAKVVFGCRGGGCKGSFLSCQARALSDLTVELTAANKYRRPMEAWRWLGRSDS
jgi:hypothetical protein